MGIEYQDLVHVTFKDYLEPWITIQIPKNLNSNNVTNTTRFLYNAEFEDGPKRPTVIYIEEPIVGPIDLLESTNGIPPNRDEQNESANITKHVVEVVEKSPLHSINEMVEPIESGEHVELIEEPIESKELVELIDVPPPFRIIPQKQVLYQFFNLHLKKSFVSIKLSWNSIIII